MQITPRPACRFVVSCRHEYNFLMIFLYFRLDMFETCFFDIQTNKELIQMDTHLDLSMCSLLHKSLLPPYYYITECKDSDST